MKLPPQTNKRNIPQMPSSDGYNTPSTRRAPDDMPQNHRPGSTFGTTNKPQTVAAQGMPMNHGYGKRVFSAGAKGNKFASGGKKPPGCC